MSFQAITGVGRGGALSTDSITEVLVTLIYNIHCGEYKKQGSPWRYNCVLSLEDLRGRKVSRWIIMITKPQGWQRCDHVIGCGESDLVWTHHIDGLVQERRNSSALAMELRLSCTYPSAGSWDCWADLNDRWCLVGVCIIRFQFLHLKSFDHYFYLIM